MYVLLKHMVGATPQKYIKELNHFRQCYMENKAQGTRPRWLI